MIRNSGASEVHLRVASPPVLHACKYGIDSRKEGSLAAVRMSVQELCENINADSLSYLTEEDLVAAISLPVNQLCTACFTGKFLPDDNSGQGA